MPIQTDKPVNQEWVLYMERASSHLMLQLPIPNHFYSGFKPFWNTVVVGYLHDSAEKLFWNLSPITKYLKCVSEIHFWAVSAKNLKKAWVYQETAAVCLHVQDHCAMLLQSYQTLLTKLS